MSVQCEFDKLKDGGSETNFWNALLDSEVRVNILPHANKSAFEPLVTTEVDGKSPTVLVFTENAKPMTLEGYDLVPIYASTLVKKMHPELSITVVMKSGAILGAKDLLSAIRKNS